LLSTAADLGAPLAPALRSYLRDRPQGPAREFWVATAQFFLAPGYYWLWHRQHHFDRKVALLTVHLESGASLAAAMQAVPGVVPRETLVAATVGESVGQLGRSLKRLTPGRLSAVWMDILPRFIYPLCLMGIMALAITFISVFIIPKMHRVMQDFE